MGVAVTRVVVLVIITCVEVAVTFSNTELTNNRVSVVSTCSVDVGSMRGVTVDSLSVLLSVAADPSPVLVVSVAVFGSVISGVWVILAFSLVVVEPDRKRT